LRVGALLTSKSRQAPANLFAFRFAPAFRTSASRLYLRTKYNRHPPPRSASRPASGLLPRSLGCGSALASRSSDFAFRRSNLPVFHFPDIKAPAFSAVRLSGGILKYHIPLRLSTTNFRRLPPQCLLFASSSRRSANIPRHFYLVNTFSLPFPLIFEDIQRWFPC
jgi:hypothetical protein